MSQEMVHDDSSLQVERNCSIGEYTVEHNSYHLSTTQKNPNCVRALLNLTPPNKVHIPTYFEKLLCLGGKKLKCWGIKPLAHA
jgi:hypothetical protein